MVRAGRIYLSELLGDRSFWARIWAALICAVIGSGYLFIPAVKNDPPKGLQFVGRWWLDFYAVWWLVAAVLAVVLAFTRVPGERWRVFCWLPCAVWSLAYTAGWIRYGDLSWRPALLYLGVAGLIFIAVRTPPEGGWRRYRRAPVTDEPAATP